jgi:hypothetical protein
LKSEARTRFQTEKCLRVLRSWKDNSKIPLKETELEHLGWDELAEAREQAAISCEHSTAPSSSTTDREFFEQLNDYWLLKYCPP